MKDAASKTLYTDATWRIGIRLAVKLIVIIGLLLVMAFSKSDEAQAQGVTQTGNVLRGIVTTDGPVGGGTIGIYNGTELVQIQPNLEFGNGTFEIQLNSRASSLLESGDLRLEVQISQPGQAPAASDILMAELHDFDAGSQVIFINPASTIISAYRQLEPAASYTQAEAAVDTTLGLASTGLDACQPTTGPPDFDDQAFVADSQAGGGLNAAVWGMAQAAVSGGTNASYSREIASGSDAKGTNGNVESVYRDAVLRLGKGIAKLALKPIPLGDVVVGFILDQVLKAPKEDKAEQDHATEQLKAISAQLDNLLSGIQGISAELANVEARLSAQANLIAYQTAAAKIQTNINHLCNLNADLLFLAAAPVAEDNTDFAKTLIANIQTTSANDLSDIWSGLEGNPRLQVPGLIEQWSTVLNLPGLPEFIDNSYLTSAQINFLYYIGPQMIGTNLRVELGHALANALGESITRAALTNFDNHYNAQMKLVGLDIPIPPATRYAAEPLPADGWIVDDRSGLLWLSSNPCPPSGPGKCLFAAYPVANTPLPLLSDFVKQYDSTVHGQFKGITFSNPSRNDWSSLVNGYQGSGKSPYAWLTSKGFTFYFSRFWTSEVALRGNPSKKEYPEWTNWQIDLTTGSFSYIQLEFGGKIVPFSTAALELTAPAPDIISNPQETPVLYYPGQDNIFLAVPQRR